MYDRNFKIGFITAIGVFILLNIGAYVLTKQQYEKIAESNKFLPIGGNLRWGIPFYWSGYQSPHWLADEFVGLVLNVPVILLCALIAGFVAKRFVAK